MASAVFPYPSRIEFLVVVYYEDDFNRVVTDGWGAGWTIEGGSSGDYAVKNGYASHLARREAATRRSLRPGPADFDAVVALSIPVASSGEAAQSSFICREDGTNNNFVTFRVVYLTTGNLSFRVSKRVNGTETTLVNFGNSILPYSANSLIQIRCQAIGPQLAMKGWIGPSEPDEWLGYATVTEPHLLQAGRMGFRSSVGTNWQNWTGPNPLEFRYHRFRVLS